MLTIDETRQQVVVTDAGGRFHVHALDTPEAFALVSDAWLRCGWGVKYVYGFTWMGRPVIQLPEDLLRIQEVVWRVQPDVVVETGVAHGGSLVFYANLLAARAGRVIGIDRDIRPANRAAIQEHPLSTAITLIEADSAAPATAAQVRASIPDGARVMVVLDSNHSREHVAAELALYADLVSPGSFIVVCDGIMARLTGAPRSQPDWSWNNPQSAVEAFLAQRPDFTAEEPEFAFNEGKVRSRVTYCPKCFLRRLPA